MTINANKEVTSSKAMKDISNAEFEVLDALWEEHPASAKALVERLNEKKPWHEKTVKTLLNRLVKKEAVSFEKVQRSYLYSPLFQRDDYTQTEGKSLIDRLFSGRVSPLIAGFAKNKNLKKDDIEDLKQIIANWEQDQEQRK